MKTRLVICLLSREVEELIQQASVATMEPLKFSSKHPQDSLTQFKICYWKQNLVYWRSPKYNVVRLFFTTFAAFIFGSVFWNVGLKRYFLSYNMLDYAMDKFWLSVVLRDHYYLLSYFIYYCLFYCIPTYHMIKFLFINFFIF